MKRFISILTIQLFIFASMAQSEVGGVKVFSTMKVADKVLNLNGAGIRKKLFIEVYVGALYTTTKSSDGEALAKSNDPMVMRITITSGMVTSEKMAEATREGFNKSMNGNVAPIKEKMEMFLALFKREAIKKGDVFDLAFLPSNGVNVSKNGKLLETISGIDFKTALWGIWIGKNPVDEGLKAGLLGTK